MTFGEWEGGRPGCHGAAYLDRRSEKGNVRKTTKLKEKWRDESVRRACSQEPAAELPNQGRSIRSAPKSSFISFPSSQVWMIDWRSCGIPSRQVRTSLPSPSENLHVCLRRDERSGRMSWKEPAVFVGQKQEGPARFPEAAAAPTRLSFQRCEVLRGPRCGKLPRLRMQNSLPQTGKLLLNFC